MDNATNKQTNKISLQKGYCNDMNNQRNKKIRNKAKRNRNEVSS
jgi:hypothetical protein